MLGNLSNEKCQHTNTTKNSFWIINDSSFTIIAGVAGQIGFLTGQTENIWVKHWNWTAKQKPNCINWTPIIMKCKIQYSSMGVSIVSIVAHSHYKTSHKIVWCLRKEDECLDIIATSAKNIGYNWSNVSSFCYAFINSLSEIFKWKKLK